MPDKEDKDGSVKSSEYSGTEESVKEAVAIDPYKARQALSSGEHTKQDRIRRKTAKDEEKAKENK